MGGLGTQDSRGLPLNDPVLPCLQDVFLICFSLVSPASYENVRAKVSLKCAGGHMWVAPREGGVSCYGLL